MNEEFAQDPSLVRDFVVESTELLERMDQDMVSLESAPQEDELLNRIFRAVHTIKGTAGFLGFDPIVRVSHSAEDVLNALRRGEKLLDRCAIDALLHARDQLGIMLHDVGEGGLKQYEIDALLAELKNVESSYTGPSGEVVPHEANSHEPNGEDSCNKDVSSKDVPRILLSEAADEPQAEAAAKKNSAFSGRQPDTAKLDIARLDSPKHDSAKQREGSDSASSSQTMRVEAHKLDELVNLIGELVLERNRLAQLSRDCSSSKLTSVDLSSQLGQSSARLSFITDELQVAGLKTRMLPIETVFRRFPRMVRDVAHSLNKEVQLLICGEDTELDKTMVELIGDPLVHLVRNSLDHGIEPPEIREQSGKPRQGTIRLEARQEGDQIVIGLSDDGAGMNPDRIANKALEKGLATPERLRHLSPREILDFIFLPGFSTAEKTSDLSGRGVGMDVVRSNLKKLNGSVEIDSYPGMGTTVLLRLPLTLAILPVLLVRVAEEIYALPLRSVVETAQVNLAHVHRVEDSEVLCLRNETLPLLRLGELFQSDSLSTIPADASYAEERTRKVVILGVAEKRVALLVDHLIGQESTVIKPLGNYLHRCTSLAGATISGDGRVRLVLDPAGLVAASQNMTPAFRKASA